MKRSQASFTVLAVPAVALVLGLAGCVDEEIVYRDRQLFTTPPTGAAGFLGFSKAEEKLTVCGNCHAGHQAKWIETAHASAYAALGATPAAACEGCHTVNQLGNVVDANAGYLAAKDARYQNVQCESCHGPGLEHVQNPSKATVPSVLAPFGASIENKIGCAECHGGAHIPIAEEWTGSGHGTLEASSSVAPRTACRECHTGEGALQTWGFNVNYAEKATVIGDSLRNLTITCAVCHDPHASNHERQLRFPIDALTEEENLCMKCHHKRGVPDLTSQNRGPHSEQGPILLGYGGWWPPNLEQPAGKIVGTHGSERNPRLCAGCHLNRFTFTDPLTNQQFTGTPHTFEAIPCVDGDGRPIVNGTCTDTQRTFRTCTGSSCHGSEDVARSLLGVAETRLKNLADDIDNLLLIVQPNWRTCRANNTCGATSEFNANDGRYTTAEGAAFNYELVYSGGTKDAAVHNPFLLEALLTATIRQLRTDYNLTASSIDLASQLQPPPGR
jgi:predicted CXXCH cytochrome family protein